MWESESIIHKRRFLNLDLVIVLCTLCFELCILSVGSGPLSVATSDVEKAN
jgi:hypothetical protein